MEESAESQPDGFMIFPLSNKAYPKCRPWEVPRDGMFGSILETYGLRSALAQVKIREMEERDQIFRSQLHPLGKLGLRRLTHQAGLGSHVESWPS